MHIPPSISDECADALVDLIFACLGSCDPDELCAFAGAILRIAEAEVRRAVACERRRNAERVRTPCNN